MALMCDFLAPSNGPGCRMPFFLTLNREPLGKSAPLLTSGTARESSLFKIAATKISKGKLVLHAYAVDTSQAASVEA
jgi:hypothetical protein